MNCHELRPEPGVPMNWKRAIELEKKMMRVGFGRKKKPLNANRMITIGTKKHKEDFPYMATLDMTEPPNYVCDDCYVEAEPFDMEKAQRFHEEVQKVKQILTSRDINKITEFREELGY